MLDASFVASTEADWRRLAAKALGGASLDRLASTTADGIVLAPLAARRHHGSGAWRTGRGWSVSQRVDDPDPERANAAVLDDLEGGADALILVFADSPFARGFGIAPAALDRVLAGVEIDLIGLRLDAGAGTATALAALADLIARRRLTSAELAIEVGYDPLGVEARLGVTPPDDLAAILGRRGDAGLTGGVFLADGRPTHEAGGSAGQELAAVLATGVAYLRRLEAAGWPLARAARAIGFLLCADADLFEGLAKVRAMRRLWARVEASCDLDPRPIRLHCETSWRVMTRRDPWTNTMRATVGTMAAGLGGADAVAVLPMTLPRGLPDAGARRLARNIGHVLLEEAHLGRIVDPAAGAGGPEAFTEALCERAWTLFQRIERDGGMAASLRSGAWRTRLADTAATRTDAVAAGARAIVGTTRYPSLLAHDLPVLAAPAAGPERGRNALPAGRDAEPFEALRDAADAMPAPPVVFLATMGSPAAYGRSASEAANVFAAAGMAATEAPRPADGVPLDQAGIVALYAASGAAVACLCGADHPADAASLVEALRAAGARRILRAGPPGPDEGAWRTAGVDDFVHERCAMLRVLTVALAAATETA